LLTFLCLFGLFEPGLGDLGVYRGCDRGTDGLLEDVALSRKLVSGRFLKSILLKRV